MAITRRQRELCDFISRFVAARLKPYPFKAEAVIAALNRSATQKPVHIFLQGYGVRKPVRVIRTVREE
jgi:hypothetical protein